MSGLPTFVQTVKSGDNPSYRYVRRVPSNLVDYFGKEFWKETLGRGTLDEIRQKTAEKSADIAKRIEQAEARLASGLLSEAITTAIATKTAPKRPMVLPDSVAAKGLYDALTDSRDRYIADLEADPVLDASDLASRRAKLHRQYEHGRSIVALFRDDLKEASSMAFAHAPEFTAGEMTKALASVGMTIDPVSVQFRRLWKAFAILAIEWVEAGEKVLCDEWHDPEPFEAVLTHARTLYRLEGKPVPSPMAAKAPAQPATHDQGPLYSEIFAELVREKDVGGNWTLKTKTKNDVAARHFIGLLGDRPIGSYTKADGREFKAALMVLPPNWTGQPALRGLTIKEAVAFCRKNGGLSMSAKSINNSLHDIQAHFIWAMKRYDECAVNPINGLTIQIKESARKQRLPFTVDDLNTIFSAPVYTGCKSLAQWSKPGDFIPNDSARYWIPLVAFHSGLRLGEICQLHHSNVRKQNDIWFFDIKEGEDQSLKSPAAERQVPIHQKLIDIGFLDFLDRVKDNGSIRIFADVRKAESDDMWSSHFSKQFNHTLTNLGIKRPKIVFHSFRHTMEDAYRNSGVRADVMDALQGHSASGMKERYGDGFDLANLNKAMQSVQWPGVDLSHLKP